jgi:hypothetical protein
MEQTTWNSFERDQIIHHTLNRGAFSLYVREYDGLFSPTTSFHFEYVYHPLNWLPAGTPVVKAKIVAAQRALEEARRMQTELEEEITRLEREETCDGS